MRTAVYDKTVTVNGAMFKAKAFKTGEETNPVTSLFPITPRETVTAMAGVTIGRVQALAIPM